MAEITTANPPLAANANGDTYRPRTTPINGVHHPHWLPGHPSTGDPYLLASQDDAREVRDRLGNQDAAAADSDTGTFSLIGLFKRLLSKIPALVNGPPHEDSYGLPTRPINRRNVRC